MSVKKYKYFRYKNLKTNEIFSEMREFSDRNREYIDKDGSACPRIPDTGEGARVAPGGWRKDREIFEQDPEYVKKCKPKYIEFRDGHKERYDPRKHN